MHDLTGFQRDLLWLVAANDAPKGLALKELLEEYYDGVEINHGRLYPNLDTLVGLALVEKGRKDDRTNEYRITARGRRELEARLAWEHERAERAGIDSLRPEPESEALD